MAEAVEITRQQRPVNFRQKSTINPENLERNFRHNDDEIDKIYQILGENGIINQTSIQTVIVGGGGGGGAVATTFLLLTDTPNFFNVEGILPSVNRGKSGLEFSGLNVVKDTIGLIESVIIESGHQMHVGDELVINGTLTINGKLVVL